MSTCCFGTHWTPARYTMSSASANIGWTSSQVHEWIRDPPLTPTQRIGGGNPASAAAALTRSVSQRKLNKLKAVGFVIIAGRLSSNLASLLDASTPMWGVMDFVWGGFGKVTSHLLSAGGQADGGVGETAIRPGQFAGCNRLPLTFILPPLAPCVRDLNHCGNGRLKHFR